MRDRTKELRNNANSSDENEENRVLESKPGTPLAKEEKEREAILKNAKEILEGLHSLRALVCELDKKQKTVLSQALPEESMKTDMQTLREEISTFASQIQRTLKSIEPKKEEEDGRYIPINIRIQRTQHCVLSREFVELMGFCNTLQSQYRDRSVERLRRQLKITGANVTEEELNTMLESGQTDVFTHNILSDAKATKQALNEIESRHNEILKLERSIRDLHDMFQYLALEVDAQGEMVNRIETHINQSTDYVEKAKDNTARAIKFQNKARKKKIWIAICLAILLLILGISLAVTFGT
ncbi:syntaxin-4-like [Cynoglossus semilaevis]|uniref:syntaxin-4-like n=1 Tax=Cynoglossus semilaevis TaxID=244447 RepID=UPI000495F969|nr:syntaxin-4-like [Cynoglossus semilaevis]